MFRKLLSFILEPTHLIILVVIGSIVIFNTMEKHVMTDALGQPLDEVNAMTPNLEVSDRVRRRREISKYKDWEKDPEALKEFQSLYEEHPDVPKPVKIPVRRR